MRIATIAVLAGGTVLLHAQQPATDPAAGNALAKMDAAYQTLPALHIKVQWSAKYSVGHVGGGFSSRGRTRSS